MLIVNTNKLFSEILTKFVKNNSKQFNKIALKDSIIILKNFEIQLIGNNYYFNKNLPKEFNCLTAFL